MPDTLIAWQIAVGDELLSGQTADTNSQDVQRALAGHGVRFGGIRVVPDDAGRIAAALAATEPGSLVVLSGGLGSTPDDLTREAVAAWAGVPLVPDQPTVTRLRERCRQWGIPCGEDILRQALVPDGLVPLVNPEGTAPALVGSLQGRRLVLLPGVPRELQALLVPVRSWLVEAAVLPPPAPTLLLRTAQMAELAVVHACQPVQQSHPGLHWAWRLVRWGVDVRVESSGGQAEPSPLTGVEQALREQLGLAVYAEGRQDLNELVQELMLARGATVSVAESCTAGLLAARLTEPAGSSACFRGGIVAYADDVKRDLLGVAADLLAREGAVSAPVAAAMATGCGRRFGTDYALAITGIAGPGGGSAGKPVGTTWISCALPDAVHVRRYRFPGTRNRNRQLAVVAALDTLRRLLVRPQASPWLASDSWGHAE